MWGLFNMFVLQWLWGAPTPKNVQSYKKWKWLQKEEPQAASLSPQHPIWCPPESVGCWPGYRLQTTVGCSWVFPSCPLREAGVTSGRKSTINTSRPPLPSCSKFSKHFDFEFLEPAYKNVTISEIGFFIVC